MVHKAFVSSLWLFRLKRLYDLRPSKPQALCRVGKPRWLCFCMFTKKANMSARGVKSSTQAHVSD